MTTTARAFSSTCRCARGVVLLALLLILAIGSFGVMAVSDVYALARQRHQEEELLFVGAQYRGAIERYYNAITPKVLPASIDDLLLDKRFPTTVQHLRRAYDDPITGKSDWGLVMSGERLAGVYSLSEQTTLKRANFPAEFTAFEGRETYNQWKFVFSPPVRPNRTRPAKPGASTVDVPASPLPAPATVASPRAR